jgi:adenylosuccinate lyase
MVLLKMVEKGMTREQAYAVVQDNAMRAWLEGVEFKDLLLSDRRVKSYLDPREIEGVFRLENFLGNVDYIFKRTFRGKP